MIMTALFLIASTGAAHARYIPHVDFQDFLRKADVVVIAKPITNEIVRAGVKLESYAAIELVTTFKVEVVFKGPADLAQVGLYHYDLDWKKVTRIANPPRLLEFPIGDLSNQSYVDYSYLLFLKRDSEGRLIPLLGHGEAGYSVFTLKPQEDTTMEKSNREWKKSAAEQQSGEYSPPAARSSKPTP